MDNNEKSKIHVLPGVQPRAVINHQAVQELQQIVDKLLSGDLAGVAWATVNPVGTVSYGWNAPTGMGKHLFVGVSCIGHRMMDEMNKQIDEE